MKTTENFDEVIKEVEIVGECVQLSVQIALKLSTLSSPEPMIEACCGIIKHFTNATVATLKKPHSFE